jgi:hypothetical protein
MLGIQLALHSYTTTFLDSASPFEKLEASKYILSYTHFLDAYL